MTSAVCIAAAVRSGRRDPEESASEALMSVRRVNPAINAFTAVLESRAMQSARQVRQRLRDGEHLPLAGVPYVVKNLFDVRGVTTLAGSRLLADQPAALDDADAVQRMEKAGAILIGTVTMDEFAYGFTTENSHYGPCRNPRDLERVCGGSSGGSAASVASGIVPLALGTDTNGSIRVPASLCGIAGLKPTFGRISRRGVYPFADSLDHVGAFGTCVADVSACYSAIADIRREGTGEGTGDPVDAHALRVGILGGFFESNSSASAQSAVKRAAACFDWHEHAQPSGVEEGRAAAFLITACEGGFLHMRHLRREYHSMEPASRDRLMAGALAPAAWYLLAQRVREEFRVAFMKLFDHFDILLSAATPDSAPLIGQEFIEVAGQQLPARAALGLLTQPISCIGLPAAVVPLHSPGRLPIGVQVIGAPLQEKAVLAAAMAIESTFKTTSAE